MKTNKEIRKVLKESLFNSYDIDKDELIPNMSFTRQQSKFTLGLLARLSKMRKNSIQEETIDNTFVPYIYGPQEEEQGGMGGMGPMPGM